MRDIIWTVVVIALALVVFHFGSFENMGGAIENVAKTTYHDVRTGDLERKLDKWAGVDAGVGD